MSLEVNCLDIIVCKVGSFLRVKACVIEFTSEHDAYVPACECLHQWEVHFVVVFIFQVNE